MNNDNSVLKKILTLRDNQWMEIEDPVVMEAPVTLILNGKELVTLLCTPEKIDRLALGFLRSEGFINTIDDLSMIRVKEDGLVDLELKSDSEAIEKLYGKRTITSGCGKGTVFFNVLDSLQSSPLEGKLQVEAAAITRLSKELQSHSELFKRTGGVHSAALADQNEIIFFFEDIGRHNAVDKLVGECLLGRVTMEDKFFILSGRITSEILLKAARLKTELIVSRAAPTALSIELAEKMNITLVGFARWQRMNIYTHQWRVLKEHS